MKLKFTILTIILFGFISNLLSQLNEDSLRNIIITSDNDTAIISSYILLGEQIHIDYPDSAISLTEKALKLSLEVLDSNVSNKVKDHVRISLGSCYHFIGLYYNNLGNYKKSMDLYQKALNHREEINDLKGLSVTCNNIALIYSIMGNVDESLDYYNRSLEIREELGDQLGLAESYNNIGYQLINQGKIQEALSYFQKSLKIVEKEDFKLGQGYCLSNIGQIYESIGDHEKAKSFYDQALKIRLEIEDHLGIAQTYNNLGFMYYSQGDVHLALEYLHKSKEEYLLSKDQSGLAHIVSNIGAVHYNLGIQNNDKEEIEKAFQCFNECLEIHQRNGDKEGEALMLHNIGHYYYDLNENSKAKSYALQSLEVSQKMGYPDNIQTAASLLEKIYKSEGSWKEAHEMMVLFYTMRDSVINEENQRATYRQQISYEFEKKAAIDSVAHAKKIQIKDLEIDKKAAQRNMLIIGLGIMLLLLAIIFRYYRQKRKANILLSEQKLEIEEKNEELNQQNEEIVSQRDEIESQRDLVTLQKNQIEKILKDINQSIDYAKRIQNSILPKNEQLSEMLDEHFILFMPKDVVSGDFYWVGKQKEKLIIAVADCTGHGIPGAFMSMLGMAFLNEIVISNQITNPADILENLRSNIISALKQSGQEGEQKDGMDIAIVTIDTKTRKLRFSGANNPLYLIRENNLFTIKSDKMPVSIYFRMDKYNEHEMDLASGDVLYLFSDGFADQFGGIKGKKYMYKPFRDLLLRTKTENISEQKEKLEKEFHTWKGSYNQIDDVLVMGVKIK